MPDKQTRFQRILRRSGVAVVMLAALTSGLPATPAGAEVDLTQINLELGGEAAVGWSIQNIVPCQSGSQTVTLSSIGALDGYVTIWVDNVVSGEGDNPEPETDTTGDGELDENILFNLTTDPTGRLETNITLPTTVDNLPQSYEDPNYILITPLDSGETITLYWEWELPCATGNEAQGDRLSFDIHYVLEDFEEDDDDGNGFTTTARSCFLTVDMLGDQVIVRVDCCSNSTNSSNQIYSPDGAALLGIDPWTRVTCDECEGCRGFPVLIEVTEVDDPPPPPPGATFVGPVYDFTGYRSRSACETVIFGRPVTLLFDFDPGELPDNTASVGVGYYNELSGLWEDLPPDTGRVAALGEATAQVSHLSNLPSSPEWNQPSPRTNLNHRRPP